MVHTPDARARRVERVFADGGAPPEDDRERRYFEYLRRDAAFPPPPGEEPDPTMAEAAALRATPARHVLDALLLVNTPHERLCDALLLRREVLDLYAWLWFDVAAFANGFVRRHYGRNVPDDGTPEHRAYDLALVEGYEPLLALYRIGEPPAPDPRELTARMTYELATRAMAHRGRALTSPTARHALGYAKAAIAGGGAMASLAPVENLNASQRLKIELAAGEYTLSARDAPVALAELVRTGPSAPAITPPPTAEPKP